MKRLTVEPLTDIEREQLHLVLQHTTPAERIAWLEEMRLAFGIDHLRKSQAIKLKMQDTEKPLNSPPPSDR